MNTPRIRVFVVDDHPMVRRGLAAIVGCESEFEAVGEASSAEEALQRLPGLAPDAVLMDVDLPGIDGITAIARLSPTLPGTRFVVLSGEAEPGTVRRAMAAGASGYLLKTASAREIANAIRDTHHGQRVLAAEATAALFEAHRTEAITPQLTPRECELLAAMARGLNNKEIADTLAIAMPTVKFHVTNILGKLGAENRTEAVLRAMKQRLVRAL